MLADPYNTKLLEPTFSPWRPGGPPDRQVAVLMSGGVDSSVTAQRLKEAGWEVLGITMKIPTVCSVGARGCCGADAAFVCGELGIPHYFIDVTGAFEDLIIRPFRQAYAGARTPNPCIDCNTLLKFTLVWDLLEQTFGIPYLATGHYARVVQEGGRTYLRRAADKDKDQSYFLYGIPAGRLPRLLLPVGELTKSQVRAVASQLGLSVAGKAESMELCFAGQRDYRLALDAGQADRPGDLTDMQGNRIGEHRGVAHYTLGQRRGLRFAGGKPLYVGRIDAQANTVALGTRDEVSRRTIRVGGWNILVPEKVAPGAALFGKIRSYGRPHACRLLDLSPAGSLIEFDQPQFAPCPGQRLVLYDTDENLIAGATIESP